MRQKILRFNSVFAVLLAATAAVVAQTTTPKEIVVYVNEETTFSPGFAYGDISVPQTSICNYRVVRPARREVVLMGKSEGKTTLTLWDQRGAKRLELLIRVTTRDKEAKLDAVRKLLKPYPSVELTPLGESAWVVSGEVSSERDLQAIREIAGAADMKSIVRYVPPMAVDTPVTMPPATPPATPPPPAAGGATPTPMGGGMMHPAPAMGVIEYEVQILEASVNFASGSYGQGVQPSGPVLASRTVQATVGQTAQVEFMDRVLVEKTKGDKGSGPKGVKVRFTPTAAPNEMGMFVSNVELETNLPFESKIYDPTVWRKASWQIPMKSGDPLGIAGADFLAVMAADRGSPSTWRTIQGVAGMAGGFGVPGANKTGNVYYYDRAKKTQLLMLIRPRLVVPTPSSTPARQNRAAGTPG